MERWLRGPLLHFLLFGIVLFASYAYMHRGRSEVESSRQIALTLDDLRTTAVIYVFATVTTTKAVIFLIWCIIVGLMDNILKPILLGREPPFQLGIVVLGAIGRFVAMAIIGLFVGAVVLSVGYTLNANVQVASHVGVILFCMAHRRLN